MSCIETEEARNKASAHVVASRHRSQRLPLSWSAVRNNLKSSRSSMKKHAMAEVATAAVAGKGRLPALLRQSPDQAAQAPQFTGGLRKRLFLPAALTNPSG
jgi:hypothetical protein